MLDSRNLKSRADACHATGFTLVEVMIVVAIVAILASVALPAYSDYIRRSQLQEAFTFLADYRVKMEQYFQDNKNYGTNGTCATAGSANNWNTFQPTGAEYFSFACQTNNDDQEFLVTATGNGSLTAGYAYTIDHNGNKRTISFAGASMARPCWLTKSTAC